MNDNPTMQDVLRHFYPKYLDSYTPTASQAKTVHHIRTARLVHMEPISLNVTHADISSTITIPAVTDPVRCARR